MASKLMRTLVAAGFLLGCLGQAGPVVLAQDKAAGSILLAQYGGNQQSQNNLVKPSAAARAARRVVNGKVLSIDISDRGRPVYLVKIRGSGEIRLVVVDARTGKVVNY